MRGVFYSCINFGSENLIDILIEDNRKQVSAFRIDRPVFCHYRSESVKVISKWVVRDTK